MLLLLSMGIKSTTQSTRISCGEKSLEEETDLQQ